MQDQSGRVTPAPSGRISQSGWFEHARALFDITHARTCVVLFVVLAAPSLIGLSVLVGPFQTPDEASHFYRAVQLSGGHVLPVRSPNNDAAGDYLDAALQKLGGYYTSRGYQRWKMPFGSSREDLAAAWAEPLAGHDEFTKFSNTVIYFPLAHAAPALAVLVLRQLHAPPMAWLYGGRLMNAALAMLITSVAIALFPEGRAFVFVLALLPRTLFGTASLSVDALLIPFSVLFGALVCRLASQGRLSGAQHALLILSTFFICVNKLAYIPMVAIPPVIAVLSTRRLSRSAVLLAASGLATVLIWVGWIFIIHNNIFPIRHNVPIDVYGQLRQVLTRPLNWLLVLRQTFAETGLGYVNTMVGGDLGSSETRPPTLIVGATCIFLAAAAFLGSKPVKVKLAELGFTAIIIGGVVMAIFLLLYMQYTAFDGPMVDGVQGRYFLPLLTVFVAFLPKVKPTAPFLTTFSLAAFLWLALTSAETLNLMRVRYWSSTPDTAESFRDFRGTDIE